MPSREVNQRFDRPGSRGRSTGAQLSVRASNRGGLEWVGILGTTLTVAITLDVWTAQPQWFPALHLLPLLVAAYRLGPRAVLVVGFIAIGSHLVMRPTVIQAEPAQQFQILAFMVTTCLAHRVSTQRETISRHPADDRRANLTDDARSDHLIAVAHELRNMVTALSGFIQLLRIREQYDDRLVATIARQGRRLERFGRDLSDLALPDSTSPDLERRELDIRALGHEVVEGARLAFRHHRFRLVAPAEPLVGWWDQGRLEQVFDNLISNAVKYSPDGGEVIVRLARAGESIRLTVSDPGIGIPQHDIPFIFDRFYRSQLTARVARGLGVGLYVVRRLVQAHGGHVSVSSTVGGGATFIVVLPCKYTALPDDECRVPATLAMIPPCDASPPVLRGNTSSTNGSSSGPFAEGA